MHSVRNIIDSEVTNDFESQISINCVFWMFVDDCVYDVVNKQIYDQLHLMIWGQSF